MVYPTIVPLFTMVYSYLVGGLEHCFFFHLVGRIILTDELHHFSEGFKPSTSYHFPSGAGFCNHPQSEGIRKIRHGLIGDVHAIATVDYERVYPIIIP
jgi:hypothetical protein